MYFEFQRIMRSGNISETGEKLLYTPEDCENTSCDKNNDVQEILYAR